jgi:hypothetical protein
MQKTAKFSGARGRGGGGMLVSELLDASGCDWADVRAGENLGASLELALVAELGGPRPFGLWQPTSPPRRTWAEAHRRGRRRLRLDNRLSQTTPCRHCSWCTCQRGKLGRFHRRGLLVAHKSHRRASFATLLPRESIAKHNL